MANLYKQIYSFTDSTDNITESNKYILVLLILFNNNLHGTLNLD